MTQERHRSNSLRGPPVVQLHVEGAEVQLPQRRQPRLIPLLLLELSKQGFRQRRPRGVVPSQPRAVYLKGQPCSGQITSITARASAPASAPTPKYQKELQDDTRWYPRAQFQPPLVRPCSTFSPCSRPARTVARSKHQFSMNCDGSSTASHSTPPMPAAGPCGHVVSMCCRPWPISWNSVTTWEVRPS